MINTIIFDFDGVIVESVDIKTQAFVHLFQSYSEDVRRKIVKLHLENLGLSRYEKFKRIYTDILQCGISETELDQLGVEFARYCFDKIVMAPYVKGAYEFISTYHQVYDLYVASSTPETELRAIVQRRGISHFFKGVFGTPRNKPEICRSILEQNGRSTQETVLIGDAIADFDAAQQCGLHFVARLDGTGANLLAQMPIKYKVRDLSHLCDVLLTQFA